MKAGSALLVLALGLGACTGDDAPPDATSRVADPPGDVKPAPTSDTPQPPGIDLVSAELSRIDGTLGFTATTADAIGERPRVWVVRLRETSGALRYMLYAADSAVFLCDHAEMCSDVAEGATVETATHSATVRVPMKLLGDLPDRFEWEASASGAFTANIDDTWNDFAPKATLSG